ncbi:rubrerythrin [Thermococcus sp. 21S9]|uniref:rubrerythrin n=1 Tax=Thermococcus sp. 21S9 TaxID=1638223 RepID=UPI00143CA5E1|nr:rubrerythrin [Thermococcus sp. 21S9]NJE55159.1 rubrerythrin [Thermococcus sp. 21S9]
MEGGAVPDWADEVLRELARLGPKEVLSHLIAQELKRAELYYELYEMSGEVTWDQRVPRLFKRLYENSLRRAEEYVKLFRELFPEESPEPPKIDAPGPRILKDRLWKLVYSGNVGEIIEYLIQLEDLSERILTRLEHSLSGNEEVKHVINSVRAIENTNWELLRELYRELTGEEPL